MRRPRSRQRHVCTGDVVRHHGPLRQAALRPGGIAGTNFLLRGLRVYPKIRWRTISRRVPAARVRPRTHHLQLRRSFVPRCMHASWSLELHLQHLSFRALPMRRLKALIAFGRSCALLVVLAALSHPSCGSDDSGGDNGGAGGGGGGCIGTCTPGSTCTINPPPGSAAPSILCQCTPARAWCCDGNCTDASGGSGGTCDAASDRC